MKVVGVIPAKGRSTRVPSKNRKEILGVPLFLWAANNLARVLDRSDIYVDTDSEEISSRASALGFGTIRRPPELATNATDGNQLLLWQASQVEADVYVQHLPPMVFLRKQTLREVIARVCSDVDSAFGVCREACYLWTEDGPTYDLENIPNSFTLPELIREGMGIYATRGTALANERTRVTKKHAMIELDCFESVDIDTPSDLAFARAVARGLPGDSPYLEGLATLSAPGDIKLLIVDVDGVMTDGGMIYSDSGSELKVFNTRDGIAIKRAIDSGVTVGFLSAGYNQRLIERRAAVLGVSKVSAGRTPKTETAQRWIDELGVSFEQTAFIGDDLPDVDLGKKVGFFACPSDAEELVRLQADVQLSREGGRGCVRELIDRFICPV